MLSYALSPSAPAKGSVNLKGASVFARPMVRTPFPTSPPPHVLAYTRID
jgi:hypothetical protein